MPRYFFHLHNDIDVLDEEGEEMPDLAAAHSRAVNDAREMMGVSLLEHGRIKRHHRIEVVDGSGRIVEVVRFGDVLRIEE